MKDHEGGVAGGGPRNESCVRREAWGRMGFRAVCEGIWMIASNACSGLIPLLPGFWVGSAGSDLRSLRRLWEG